MIIAANITLAKAITANFRTAKLITCLQFSSEVH